MLVRVDIIHLWQHCTLCQRQFDCRLEELYLCDVQRCRLQSTAV